MKSASSGYQTIAPGLSVLLCLLCAALFLLAFRAACSGRFPTLYAASCSQPLSDAAEYWAAAVNHARTGALTEYGTHKPLFPVFVSGLIRLFGPDLVAVHAVNLVFSAAGTMLFCLSVGSFLGFVPALWAVMLLSCFCLANGAGVMMSENLGFILGALSGTMLITSYATSSMRKYRLALFCQSLALGARSGPMLVLLTLCLPPSFSRGDSRAAQAKTAALNLAVFVLGFAANALVLRLAYDRPVPPLWNFGFSLYSLSLGGAPWNAIFTAVPELKNVPLHTASLRAFELAAQNMADNPLPFIAALWHSVKFYLWDGGIRYFIPFAAVGILFQVSLGFGVLLCLTRSGNYRREVLINSLALLVSLAFLFDGAFRARIIAAVVPLFAILSLHGLAPLQLILPRIRIERPSPGGLFALSALVFGLVLSLIGAALAGI